MITSSMARVSRILSLVVFLGLAAAGCAGDQGGAGMMAAGNQQGPPQMMAPGPGYSYSPLSCSVPSSVAGQRVNVTLADMGMSAMMDGIAPMSSHMMLSASPATVTAGQVSLVASNVGWRTHELVILPLTAGAAAGQRVVGSDGKISETGSLGEASASCAAGSGDGITSGQLGWVTLTLNPGRYELLCNLQNHYAAGMHLEFTVT